MGDRWALVVDGREVKRFPTRLQCVTEAFERGLMLRGSRDFPGDPGSLETVSLRDGVTIVALEAPTPSDPRLRGDTAPGDRGKRSIPDSEVKK